MFGDLSESSKAALLASTDAASGHSRPATPSNKTNVRDASVTRRFTRPFVSRLTHPAALFSRMRLQKRWSLAGRLSSSSLGKWRGSPAPSPQRRQIGGPTNFTHVSHITPETAEQHLGLPRRGSGSSESSAATPGPSPRRVSFAAEPTGEAPGGQHPQEGRLPPPGPVLPGAPVGTTGPPPGALSMTAASTEPHRAPLDDALDWSDEEVFV